MSLVTDIYARIGAVKTFFSERIEKLRSHDGNVDPVFEYMDDVCETLDIRFQQLAHDESLRQEACSSSDGGELRVREHPYVANGDDEIMMPYPGEYVKVTGIKKQSDYRDAAAIRDCRVGKVFKVKGSIVRIVHRDDGGLIGEVRVYKDDPSGYAVLASDVYSWIVCSSEDGKPVRYE